MIFDLAECEEIVGYSFRDKQLLRTAFTHTSYANEHNSKSYERMEYLGDALLDLIVAEYLYKKYPAAGEGELSTKRAKLVSQAPLKEIAKNLNMGSCVLLGDGGEKSGERENDKILSSLIESALAAVYLDGGMEPARRFVENRILCHADDILRASGDYKTELQEFVQKNHMGAVSYREEGKSGPDHSPMFECSVSLGGTELARGKGGKKQQAEQDAARLALAQLKASVKTEPAAKTETPAEPAQKKRAGRKEKRPGEVRVLSLVEDYNEGAAEDKTDAGFTKKAQSGAGKKGAKTQDVAAKSDKKKKNGDKKQGSVFHKKPAANLAENSAKTGAKPGKAAKTKAPAEKQEKPAAPAGNAAKQASGKTEKPAAPAEKQVKPEKKKRTLFGFIGNSKTGGEGTPL